MGLILKILSLPWPLNSGIYSSRTKKSNAICKPFCQSLSTACGLFFCYSWSCDLVCLSGNGFDFKNSSVALAAKIVQFIHQRPKTLTQYEICISLSQSLSTACGLFFCYSCWIWVGDLWRGWNGWHSHGTAGGPSFQVAFKKQRLASFSRCETSRHR